ncbi:hypothetical protein HK101_003146 [Irineochytrium annulatum]|nr:hypothetical protein HK101_003146 [Irineochytrium annulatum]
MRAALLERLGGRVDVAEKLEACAAEGYEARAAKKARVDMGGMDSASTTSSSGGGGSGNSGGSATKSSGNTLLFSFDKQPDQWKFSMSMPTEFANPSGMTANQGTGASSAFGKGRESVTLTTCWMKHSGPSFPVFALDESYEVAGMLPRSYFGVLQAHCVAHSFVFEYTGHDSFYFQEMIGLRRTTYVPISLVGADEKWELHLKHSKEKTNLFGYLVKSADMRNFIQMRANAFILQRKLPLVLDLDDTLVRVVGNEPGRYVPENGRRVVLTERVEEFLEWAQRFFEISVCSLGEQNYVDMVVQVLDPGKTRIRGINYSARSEYAHIQQSRNPRRPPKDLISLYPFVGSLRQPELLDGPPVDPIVVDDNVGMWPIDQQDNIIVVKESKAADVWNVHLFPTVQSVLAGVHAEFFRQLDAWDRVSLPPSACRLYKEHLRAELMRRIAEP